MIERERASWLYTVFPPIAMALIKHPDVRDDATARACAG